MNTFFYRTLLAASVSVGCPCLLASVPFMMERGKIQEEIPREDALDKIPNFT